MCGTYSVARREIGRQDAQRGRILVHRLDEAGRERRHGFIVLDGAPDDLVVDVRDVADVFDLVARCLEPAVDDVERHHHPGMTDVAVIVNRHPAHVHVDLAGLEGNEYLLVTRERVVDLELAHRMFARGLEHDARNAALRQCRDVAGASGVSGPRILGTLFFLIESAVRRKV
jgi:hypothetical protein